MTPPGATSLPPLKDGVVVGVIMGSTSDWETMKNVADTLDVFDVGYEVRVVSAHRTPELLHEYAGQAAGRGLKVIIAGAGGAAHLPGMTASLTSVPVVGIPVQSKALNGLDSLLSIVQMPAGVPVATMAIGRAGAVNAALLAVRMLGIADPATRQRMDDYRAALRDDVLALPDPRDA